MSIFNNIEHFMLQEQVNQQMSVAYMNDRNNAYTAMSSNFHGSSIYWNDESNAQHRRLDRSQSEPCTRTNVNSSRYKTELCRPFEEKGYCKYSDKCQFAHGEHELKTITRHPKYKTDLCHKYHTDGFCGYGTRCNFIHNETEHQLSRIIVNNKQALVLQQQRQKDNVNKQRPSFPGPIKRPTSISYNGSLSRPTSSLSSDSSPCLSSSPSLSPTFMDNDDLAFQPSSPYRNNNNSSPSAIIDNVSQMMELAHLFVPLYVQTQDDSTTLNQQNDRDLDMSDLMTELSNIITPHSPPDSISGDSLSSSGSSLDFTGVACPSPDHNLRLPVFAQLGAQC